VEIYIRLISDFRVSKCKAIFALASFHNSFAQFLSLCGVLTESCPIVVNLQVCFSLLERVLRVSNFRVFFTATDVLAVDYFEIATYVQKVLEKWTLTSL